MANIQIQNLPSAASPLNGGAYLVIKDGLQDKKATVSQLREIDISALSPIDTPLASDLVMIGRGANTFKTLFQNVGFVKDVTMWFYSATAPLGWVHVESLADCLLGVSGGLEYINPGSGTDGTWQQEDHTLTIAEIPPHSHLYSFGSDQSNASSEFAHGARFPSGRAGTTLNTGGNQGHNHGDTWRPLAAVGIIARKT